MAWKHQQRWIASLAALLFLAWFVWYFSALVAYVLIAAALSFIGHPIVRFLDSLRFRKYHIPHTLSSVITLILLLVIIFSLIGVFVPLIAQQANMISRIAVDEIYGAFKEPLDKMQVFLTEYGLLNQEQSLQAIVTGELQAIFSAIDFSRIVNYIVTFTGTIFVGLFAIVFVTFFFLRDEKLFFRSIMLIVPLRYQEEAENILTSSKRLLSRYFIGIVIEILTMMFLLSVGLKLLGVKNALMIGFFGGLMNVIPYLGPVMGAILGVVIGITAQLSFGIYDDLFMVIVKILGTFIGANLIDNLVLQPLIYSSSVKAHPLEIFLVILLAGSLAGIPGMILAIPTYTVIRIIAKEFLSQLRIVQKLTERM